MAGYVKLHRDAIEHKVFDDPWLWKLFCWCLMKANFKPSNYMGIEVPVGSFVTGRVMASEELKVPGSKWYKGMVKLSSKKFGCISMNPNNRFTLVSVCNYTTYQADTSAIEQRKNNKRATKGQPGNTIEECKESKEGKETYPLPPEFDCDEFRKAWGEWQQHRKEIKLPMTPLAITKQFNKFAEWGLQRTLAAIEASILKQWKGVWEGHEVRPTSNDTSNSPDAVKRNLEALEAASQKLFKGMEDDQ